MSKYGITIYRTDVYGPDPGLDFSVTPIELTVLDFNAVEVIWRQSSGSYSMARLLRSQNSFPETVDDGEIVWQQESADGSAISLSKNTLIDGRENPNNVSLVTGKPVFYRMFLFDTESRQWLKAGDARTLIPARHNLHKELMQWIPRVYTSADQNPIGIIDTESDIYRFLDGFSFTGEELMTYVDILQPTKSQDRYTHVPRVELERASLGLLPEPTLPVKNQRTLIREARYLYSKKGTIPGIEGYVEALTGFAPTVTVYPNLLLSNQDATFHLTSGNWQVSAGTIAVVKDAASLETIEETYRVDDSYFGRVVSATSGVTMSLGYDSAPITSKIPVTPGKTYTFSFYYKTESTKTITPKVALYDQHGNNLGEVTASAVTNTSWTKATISNIEAYKSVNQAITFADSDGTTVTYVTATAPEVSVGSTVTISGFENTDFNLEDATVASITDDGFTVTSSVAEAFEAPATGNVATEYQGNDALYAGIHLTLGTAGTYEVDMFCLQEGDSSDYSEARAVNIVLNPYKTNYITNPSFEPDIIDNDIPEWTVDGADVEHSTDTPPHINSGDKSALITSESSWGIYSNRVPVIKGQYWTASMYYKSDEPITLSLIKRNSSAVIVEDNFIEFPASSTWTRADVTSTVDCACVSATLEIGISGTAGTFYVDAVQLEKAYRVTEYYDGGYAFDSGAEWLGTANESYTIIYPNKPLKIWRLTNTITDWVPKHLFWTISTLSQVESRTTVE